MTLPISADDFVRDQPVMPGRYWVSLAERSQVELQVFGTWSADSLYCPVPVVFADREGYGEQLCASEPGNARAESGDDYRFLFTSTGHRDAKFPDDEWFTGMPGENFQQRLAELLRRLAETLGRELLLVGRSNGGFAALCCAERLGPIASALTWDAETNILACLRPQVDRYLWSTIGQKFDLSDDNGRATALRALGSVGIQQSVDAATKGNGPRRLLLLYSSGDWRLRAHAARLVESLALEQRSAGVLAHPAQDHRLLIRRFSAEPGNPLPQMISLVARSEMTMSEVESAVESSGALPAASEDLPMDLRATAAALKKASHLTATRESDRVTVGVVVPGAPNGHGGRYIHVVASGEGMRLAASTAGDSVTFNNAYAVDELHVTVLDGWGNPIFMLRTNDIRPTARPAAEHIEKLSVSIDVYSREPGTLDVAVQTVKSAYVTLQLFRGAEMLQQRPSSQSHRYRFEVETPGLYRVRAFVLDANGRRNAVTSRHVQVDAQ